MKFVVPPQFGPMVRPQSRLAATEECPQEATDTDCPAKVAECPSEICGSDHCTADVCKSNLCGVDLCAGDACAYDFCAVEACAGAVCGADTCTADGCAADVCGGDICGAQGCPKDLCWVDWLGWCAEDFCQLLDPDVPCDPQARSPLCPTDAGCPVDSICGSEVA